MAGRIRADDVASVKDKVSLDQVVSQHVTLRRAGPGSFKGLCPFHDERTPSFTVRPAVGHWHCFGCGEGGDVIEFVQRVEHVTFVEAVEMLAAQVGVQLRYEDGDVTAATSERGVRSRLIDAHKVAAEFYHEALLTSPEARVARDFLRAKGFDSAAAGHFQVGYSPHAGMALLEHLRGVGFTVDELVAAGLVGVSGRGPYDRFRGRAMWPIRDIVGDPIGFGARRLREDDRIQAKYLNTSETPVYRKTSVLYGLDVAKKHIAASRQAVVVEGYTDVMAAHMAGVTTAVATCGTAFGVDHVKVLRRLLRDETGGVQARTIFTFDGDAAGQKAAMRAFAEDGMWASQSFVAVAPGGQDPCDVRVTAGDQAVVDLIEGATPMFDFVARTLIGQCDTATADGRVHAMRAVAPVVASIRDTTQREEYVRTAAGWIGVEMGQLAREVAVAAAAPAPAPAPSRPVAEEASAPPTTVVAQLPPTHDPVAAKEQQLLTSAVQYPQVMPWCEVAEVSRWGMAYPVHQMIWDAIAARATEALTLSTAAWADAIVAGVPTSVQAAVVQLSVLTLPTRMGPDGIPEERYIRSLVTGVCEAGVQRRLDDVMAQARRLETLGDAGALAAYGEANELIKRQAEMRASWA